MVAISKKTSTKQPKKISWESFQKRYLTKEDGYKYEWLDPDFIKSFNRLFKNNADGTFSEKTYQLNAHDEDKLPFCASFIDYNNDKWPDIYIANDKLTFNTLLSNRRGTFDDISMTLVHPPSTE